MKLVGVLSQLVDVRAIALMTIVFVPIERLIPWKRRQATLRAGWKGDLIYLVLNGALINVAVAIAVSAIALLRPHLVSGAVWGSVTHQPVWLQIVELTLLADLAHYGTHRLFHTVPALWPFHALHHSSEQLDWLATFRVHPLDQIPTSIAMMLPVLALGWSPWAIGVWASVYRWHALAQHSNVRLPLGRLGLVVVGPELHRWHHSLAAEARNKNFAAQFAVWDIVFGTYYLPKTMTSAPHGIEEVLPKAYVDQLSQPFRELVRKSPAGSGPTPRRAASMAPAASNPAQPR